MDLSKLTEEERNELDGPLTLERFHKLFRRCVLGSHLDWMGFLQNSSNPLESIRAGLIRSFS